MVANHKCLILGILICALAVLSGNDFMGGEFPSKTISYPWIYGFEYSGVANPYLSCNLAPLFLNMNMITSYFNKPMLSFTNLSKPLKRERINTRIRRTRNSTRPKIFSYSRLHILYKRKKRKGKCITLAAEQIIKEYARTKQDYLLLGRIDNTSLIEAHYHKSCYRHYTRIYARYPSLNRVRK